jgi:hypothetical protein
MNNPLSFFNSKSGRLHEGKVQFFLSGSASDYNITYTGNDEKVHQMEHVGKKWRYSFIAHDGDYVYFAAQSNEPGKDVQVKIVYHGKTFREVKKNGDFALAHAGGCLC